jgi:hypothetical protein
VKDIIGQRQVLDRLPPLEARRTLGVRLAPDGNEIAEFKYLRSVAEEWRDKARTGHLSRPAAWLNLTTTVLKTLQYPLAATTFTEKQCTAIMAPVLEARLATSGICRTFPRDLVYGPLKYQGLALPNLYTVQGIEHILTIMEFGYDMRTLTGQLLKGNLEAVKLELGVGTPVFVTDFRKYGALATSS